MGFIFIILLSIICLLFCFRKFFHKPYYELESFDDNTKIATLYIYKGSRWGSGYYHPYRFKLIDDKLQYIDLKLNKKISLIICVIVFLIWVFMFLFNGNLTFINALFSLIGSLFIYVLITAGNYYHIYSLRRILIKLINKDSEV